MFPFTICGDQFCLGGSPVFLNILGYAPLEPCQEYDDPIHETRIQEDLQRCLSYQSGCDPVLLRVYPQPTALNPIRLPQSFYDGVRNLGFWVIRDIYLPFDCDPVVGQQLIGAAIAEVEAAGALDVIFAWEFGNEFDCPACAGLAGFLDNMCLYLKEQMSQPGREGFSDWTTWASWHKCDPLYTDPQGFPVTDIPCLDYWSYNVYPYDPEHRRDHQGGHGTGTPYAGYLAALKEYLSEKPIVVSEAGLSDCPTPGGWEHPRLKPWYPTYRFGGLTPDQVAEGLADLYWAVRLSDLAGIGFFEWNDEWWKCEEENDPCQHAIGYDKAPEEWFGLLSFDKYEHNVADVARSKLQQETVRELFTMCLPAESPTIELTPVDASIPKHGSTTIHAEVSGAVPPVRFRWETTRGHIVGDSHVVTLHAGRHALGPATITATVIDRDGRANSDSVTVYITTPEEPGLSCLTLGPGPLSEGRASGRTADVSLSEYKVAVYIETNQLYVQPYGSMTSIWVRPDGYWWTQVSNEFDGDLHAWLVPSSSDPPLTAPSGWSPPDAVASCTLDAANDVDNDLLPDSWELVYFGHLSHDRYDDPDEDSADSLEEFLSGSDPTVPDNDSEPDELPDSWEYLYFGTLEYDSDDDPDVDQLDNAMELTLGIHPGRSAADRDRDGLPDSWEIRFCGTLAVDPEDPAGEGLTNRDAYDFATPPLCPPIPTVSEWGLVLLAILLIASGVCIFRRRCGGEEAKA